MSKLNLGGKLLRSSSAATVSQVWRMGVMLGTQMVLRRLIGPDEWGFWNWAVDFLFVILAQVRDLGIPAHVVRDPQRPYGSLLAVELVWGAVLTLCLFFASPFLIHLSAESSYAGVLMLQALVLFFFFEGLAKVPLTFFEAEIRIERVFAPEIARNLVYAVLSISLAMAGYGVVSLLVAHVTGAAVYAGLLWWRAYAEMPLERSRGGLWKLLRPSLVLMLMAMVLLAVETVDLQVLALHVSVEVVGLYGGAMVLATMVLRALEWPLRRALYPTFVAVRDDPQRFFETYRLSTLLLMAIHVPVAGMFLLNAKLVLWLAWGDDYLPAAPFLQLLGLVPLVQPFVRCAEDVLLPRHEERILTMGSVINLVALVALGFLLTGLLGPVGMAGAKLLPVGALIITRAIYRVDPGGFRRLAVDLLKLYGIAGVLFGAAYLVAGDHAWLRLALSALAGAASFLLYVRLFGRAFRDFFRGAGSVGH